MLRTWDRSMEDTYLRQTTQVADSEVFAQADISPDGRRVAYRWLDNSGTGRVTFVDTVTGEATPAARLPVDDGPWQYGTWAPKGGQYVAWCEQCAELGIVSVADSATGTVRARKVIDGDGSVMSLGYFDDGSLLVGAVDGGASETFVADAVTLLPRGERFDVTTNCCATPIGDGSTAMVYEITSDDTRWRVIDVTTGEVLSEGDAGMYVYASVASPDGSTVAVVGDTGEIVTIDVSTGDERAGIPPVSMPESGGSTTPTTESFWSPVPPTVGSACGTPRRWTCSAPCTRPTTARRRSRLVRSSSARATTWRSRPTTAASTGGRPTSTGPSTSRARWPAGT